MKKITLLKKLISLILRNGIFLKLKINLSVGLVGSNLPSILSLVLELLRKHILFQELMKSVVCLIEEVLMIFLQRNPVICIYIYIYILCREPWATSWSCLGPSHDDSGPVTAHIVENYKGKSRE